MNKKMVALAALAVILLGVGAISMRRSGTDGAAPEKERRITVIATLFPQFDFARQVAGARADVKLLLPPGTEAHMFDPQPADMKAIMDSDVFIYTGKEMEPWAARIIAGIGGERPLVVDASVGVELEGDDEEPDHEGHEHGADPHFWLDPDLAAVMVENVTDALCEVDPDGAALYRENSAKLKGELERLDKDTEALVDGASRRTLVFGGHFAYWYFLNRYGLEYVTVYDKLSGESEPNARSVADAMEFIKARGIPCIYYGELENPAVARSIAEECGIAAELFDTAHNVTREDFERGVTFIDIMRGNLARIKKGLY